jgi:hypothetical protein
LLPNLGGEHINVIFEEEELKGNVVAWNYRIV